jgi:hypothetical protein
MSDEQIELITLQQFKEKALSIDPDWIIVKDPIKLARHMRLYKRKYLKVDDIGRISPK